MEDDYKFWFCWVSGSKTPMFKHQDVDKAKEEAERLARLPENLGRPVYILESMCYVMVEQSPLKIVMTYKTEEPPF